MNKGVTKQELIKSLEYTLKLTRAGVIALDLTTTYEVDDTVLIYLEGGGTQSVNIACDSGIAIIRDVCRAID